MKCHRRGSAWSRLAGCGLVIALATAGAACNKDDQAAAEKAQRDAADKAQEAMREAEEKVAAARREGEAAAQDAAKQRAEARAALQKDVDAIDRKISYLKEQASTVKGAAQKNAAAAQAEVDTRRTALRTDLAKLEAETGAAWDTAKATVERDMTAVKASVDSWESTVTGKPAH